MTVKAQKPIVIFRGDNTAAFDLRTITILLTGDLDLTNATARFDLLGFTKSWTAEEVATGELSIVFDSAQTKAFALGPQTGTLRLFDMSTGTPRQLTIVNKIPFFVTNNVCEIDSQSYGVNVRVSGGDVIHIEFKVEARAVEGKADKVKNATTGDLASLTPDGNLEDSGIPKTDVLRKSQMDSTPTEGSSNPVTSDGIKQAIDAATPSDYAEVKAKVAANTGDIAELALALAGKVPTSRKVNNKTLATDIELDAADVGALPASSVVAPSSSATTGQAADAKATGDALEPLLFAQYYPDGSVKSAAEFTSGIKYNDPDTINRTITVKPFCNTGTEANDNSSLSGRVVIPPFVDAQGNGYISDDGTRHKVVEVSGLGSYTPVNTNLTAIIAPTTVTTVGVCGFYACTSLTSVSLPTATTIGNAAFAHCTSLTSVSLPTATTIGNAAFARCTSLTSVSLPVAVTVGQHAFSESTALVSVSLPSATRIEEEAFYICTSLTSVSLSAVTNIGDRAFARCTSLTSVSLPVAVTVGNGAFLFCPALTSIDFGDTPRLSVPTLDINAFRGVPTTCKIIVPYTQYDAWIAADGWRDLQQEFVRHSEKADKPATFTTGNLAALDANGNPTDSTIPAANVAMKDNITYTIGTPIVINTASSETVEGETVYYGAATLANRTANIVQVTAATALDELRITFPAATSGKVRDFGLRVEIGTGSAALTAPALVPIAPTGETVKIENADGTIPELADGTATAKGVTLLYFSENAPGVFVVKGEQVEEVA